MDISLIDRTTRLVDTERPVRNGIPHRISGLTQLVTKFVEERGGDKVIQSVLVANNGLAAVKFMRSVRMWTTQTFGSDKAVTLVAMATPEDIRINAEHVQLADQFVEVPGGTNNKNYANVRLILQTAERAQVDAVWPGWGHASEDPQLPAELNATTDGIRFLGPPSAAMAALGDKVGSTILAQAAGVPTYSWSGTGVKMSFRECNGVIPKDVYERACLQTENAISRCRTIGFPVMLKASWGGGGKGIRTVHSDHDVDCILKQVQGEVPGSPIFAMKLATRCRHLEVQLLCDYYRNVCSLFSRDCSLQRRHQKIVEEGPVQQVPPTLLAEMEKSARALAKSVGYVGAATVEYLYSIEQGKYYFLELNPRLQVEHPVTEGITGINLPSCQLMIGMGIPLHCIPDVRSLFEEDPTGTSVIDFETHDRRDPDGHVLAVRITSENANDGFKPTSGSIEELHFRPTADVWGYFSVKSGGGIHEFSDSQFGHLFSKGATRQEAIRSMVLALKEVKIRGEIRTTVDYIIDMIQEEDFRFQRIHTAWLDNRIAMQITSKRPPWHLALMSGAVVKAIETLASRSAEFLDLLKKGQIPSSSFSVTHLKEDLVFDGVKYSIDVSVQGLHRYRVLLNGSALDCVARRQADGGILLQLDGQKHVVYSENEAMGVRLTIDSWTCLLANESDPSQVVAPSAGKIRRFLVEDGAHVQSDEAYAELEVMKMLMPLLAPVDGTVHFQLPEGAVINCGDLIAKLELDDPATVSKTEVSEERFPETLGPPQVCSDQVDDRFTIALQAAEDLLAGYECDVQSTFSDLLRCLEDKDLASLFWSKRFSVAQSRLPTSMREELELIMKSCDNSCFDIIPDVTCMEFPAESLLQCMKRHLQATSIQDRSALETTLEPLSTVAEEHRGGGYAARVTTKLLETYLDVEEKFQLKNDSLTEQDIIYYLRQEYDENLQRVLDLVISHQAVKRKAEFVKLLLGQVVLRSPEQYRPILRRLAAISSTDTYQILKKAGFLLEETLLAELKSAVARCLSGLDMFVGRGNPQQSSPSALRQISSCEVPTRKEGKSEQIYKGAQNLSASQIATTQLEAEKIAMLVEAPAAIEDALALLLDLPKSRSSETAMTAVDQVLTLGIEYRALVTYIQRTYYQQLTSKPMIQTLRHCLVATWSFRDSFGDGMERHGCMIVLNSLQHLSEGVIALNKVYERAENSLKAGVLHIALVGNERNRFAVSSEAEGLGNVGSSLDGELDDLFVKDERVIDHLSDADPKDAATHIQTELNSKSDGLRSLHFDRISVVIQTEKLPLRKGYSWNALTGVYQPQLSMRYVEAPIAEALELKRLEHFTMQHSPSRNRQWHIYTVKEKTNRGVILTRLFLRGLLYQIGSTPDFLTASYSNNAVDVVTAAIGEITTTLSGCLKELQHVKHGFTDDSGGNVDWAHIFLSLLPPVALDLNNNDAIVNAITSVCARWMTKECATLRDTRVAVIELKISVNHGDAPWRIVLSLPTGHEIGEDHVDVYREKMTDGVVVYAPQSLPEGDLAYRPVLQPYEALSFIQQKRLVAKRHGTTYCYDFPTVFDNALRDIWSERSSAGEPSSTPPATPLVTVQELGFRQQNLETSPYTWKLEEISQQPGRNTMGMVSWLMTTKTPEAPEGRKAIVIANDITFQSGAFGPKEDALFNAAVEYALDLKLPVIYLAANSGARVGLATDVRERLKVEWINEDDPSKGFHYLYLDSADYQELSQKRVEGSDCQPVVAQELENGRWMLTDVIGCEDGLGVECLSGSGAIAGTFNKAFRQGFTITLVSSRTVGIGAYLARLGRRCVQTNHPIILTGYQALNKLLGREVYTSHLQLGGPRVMGVNGVSHHTVDDDLQGVKTILKWLSFTPCILGDIANQLPSIDPIDREIAYFPDEGSKLDARKAIAGYMADEEWISGLFDKGTWIEAQQGWAQTVVTGRARLGGVAVGVISVETQTVVKKLPADPGMVESAEQLIPQAGQVWFPDSALKTAHAMEEFDLEGLPLLILANWRGFSGGQRDLFEGVLQAGSLIVENLRTYKHPVFVYLPPKCELRGGAWVVIDSKINSSKVEMYADPSARGGVLEPEGVVEIKFKKPDLIKMMHRLDPQLIAMEKQGACRQEIVKREQSLLSFYHQVALQFAEMHDTPNRMKGKGIIHGVVPWREARAFLGKRLQRRLLESRLIQQVASAEPSMCNEHASALIFSWFEDTIAGDRSVSDRNVLWSDDSVFMKWVNSSPGSEKIATELESLRVAAATRFLRHQFSTMEAKEELLTVLKSMSNEDADFKRMLCQTVEELRKLPSSQC